MIYKFSPLDLEKMYDLIKSIPDSKFIAAYMSQVTGEFYMDSATKEELDKHKIEYDLLEEIDADKLSILYANPAQVECMPLEESIKSFVLAHSTDAIGAVCIGVNCEKEFSRDLMINGWQYFQWQVPGSEDRHLWRMFFSKDEAAEFLGHFFPGYEEAKKWVQALPGQLSPPPGAVTLNPKMKDLRKKG